MYRKDGLFWIHQWAVLDTYEISIFLMNESKIVSGMVKLERGPAPLTTRNDRHTI